MPIYDDVKSEMEQALEGRKRALAAAQTLSAPSPQALQAIQTPQQGPLPTYTRPGVLDSIGAGLARGTGVGGFVQGSDPQLEKAVNDGGLVAQLSEIAGEIAPVAGPAAIAASAALGPLGPAAALSASLLAGTAGGALKNYGQNRAKGVDDSLASAQNALKEGVDEAVLNEVGGAALKAAPKAIGYAGKKVLEKVVPGGGMLGRLLGKGGNASKAINAVADSEWGQEVGQEAAKAAELQYGQKATELLAFTKVVPTANRDLTHANVVAARRTVGKQLGTMYDQLRNVPAADADVMVKQVQAAFTSQLNKTALSNAERLAVQKQAENIAQTLVRPVTRHTQDVNGAFSSEGAGNAVTIGAIQDVRTALKDLAETSAGPLRQHYYTVRSRLSDVLEQHVEKAEPRVYETLKGLKDRYAGLKDLDNIFTGKMTGNVHETAGNLQARGVNVANELRSQAQTRAAQAEARLAGPPSEEEILLSAKRRALGGDSWLGKGEAKATPKQAAERTVVPEMKKAKK